MKSVSVPSNTHPIFLQPLEEIPDCEYLVEDNATATVLVYSAGKKDIEGKTHMRLVGHGSEAVIIGVFMPQGDTKISLHTLQHHEAKETTSNLLVKTVLEGNTTFSYDGAIRVEKEGQKTNAYQRNENLILSDNAHAQSKPSLEILADDVRCTHGATIGTIDYDQLFYLSSRGIGEKEGKKLIIQGFLDHALSQVSDLSKRQTVEGVLWQNL